MLRRAFASTAVIAALVTGTVAGTAGPAAAVVEAETTSSEAAVLRQAEEALSGIRTMQARFMQMSSQGGHAEGTLRLQRPGRMRLDYDAAPVLVLADGTWLIYVDTEVEQATNVPLGSTPAGVLLRAGLSFDDPDVVVTGVRRGKGVAEIDVQMAADRGAGTLTLVFEDKPFALRQWRVKDAQGVETVVSLFDVRTGMTFPNETFVYNQVLKSYR
jgi:outer membrane lipoprotein-sorting protein